MTIQEKGSSPQAVAVAGATGYLGRHLVEALAARGHRVRALVRAGKAFPIDGGECVEVDVTQPDTLQGVFKETSAVFSALGITRQKDKVSYEDIEFTANMNVAREAAQSGVERFGVISAIKPQLFSDLAIMKSKERFIRELKEMGFATTIVRGTGFFSDLKEVFDMASAGRVYLLGDGTQKINPLHGVDLANACIDSWLESEPTPYRELEIGGPDVLTWNEIAELAFQKAERPPRVMRIPLWIPRVLLSLIKPFHARSFDVGQFIVRGASGDMVAPKHGQMHLSDFYEELHTMQRKEES